MWFCVCVGVDVCLLCTVLFLFILCCVCLPACGFVMRLCVGVFLCAQSELVCLSLLVSVCMCSCVFVCVCVYVCETVWTHQHLLRSCCGTTSDRDQDTGLTQACSLGISAGSQRQLQNVLMTSSSIQAKWVISVRLFWMCCLDAWHPEALLQGRRDLGSREIGLDFLPSSVHSLNIALSREGSQRQCIRHPNTDVIFIMLVIQRRLKGTVKLLFILEWLATLQYSVLQFWGSRSHWF